MLNIYQQQQHEAYNITWTLQNWKKSFKIPKGLSDRKQKKKHQRK